MGLLSDLSSSFATLMMFLFIEKLIMKKIFLGPQISIQELPKCIKKIGKLHVANEVYRNYILQLHEKMQFLNGEKSYC